MLSNNFEKNIFRKLYLCETVFPHSYQHKIHPVLHTKPFWSNVAVFILCLSDKLWRKSSFTYWWSINTFYFFHRTSQTIQGVFLLICRNSLPVMVWRKSFECRSHATLGFLLHVAIFIKSLISFIFTFDFHFCDPH